MKAVANILIYCGAFLCLQFAIGQLLLKSKQLANALLALILLTLALNQCYNGLYLENQLQHLPSLIYLNLPLLFFLGPLAFLYLRSTALAEKKISWPDLLLFMPASVALLFYFYGQSITAPCKIAAVYDFSLHCSTYVSVAYFATILANMTIVLFLTLALVTLEKNNGEKALKLATLISLVFSIASSWAVFLDIEALRLTSVATTGFVSLGYFWGIRQVSLMQIQRLKALGSQYEYSYTKGLDIQKILSRLNALIEKEKIHREADLTALKLAEKLNISKHQLSQLLNQHKQQSFRQLINHARINDAKALLIEDQQKTILEIAFLVGFNSKGVFNDIFRKITQKTPSSFRKSN